MKVIRERICNAVHKCLQWEDGEIAGIDMLKLEQQIDGILAQLQQHIVMQSEGSDGAEGAAVGQRSGDTATCGVDDNGWNCKKTTEPGGVASQCMNGCVLAGSSCEG
ncbi:MAG: hypothetical protein IM607_09465 [Cytophagales bacterium]|jgi:hypothetical protein|nr:hypothetical protein [Cytophagales bacterium]